MPILPNVRQERFARAIAKGLTNEAAMAFAGYRACRSVIARANGARLKSFENVKQRIAELRAMQNTKHRVTVESLMDDLRQDRDLARSLGQPGAALQATQLMAKLVGLLVDRKESGAPGDFAQLQTREDVFARVRQEMGDDAARLLSALLSASDKSQLSDVPELSPPDALKH